ncbi:early nodulin-like protein 18 isoform X2 [Aristolochia californica]|uniref:early nodulin-like protein 18 isoform X2 n=1 Tax=Aristolochia californica TaxID=171875 RepID=UPI0035D7F884
MTITTFALVLLSLVIFFVHGGYSKTVVVDGLAEWTNPTVHVGDSLIFKHKGPYNLHIFRNKRAFDLCNFSQSTLLNSDSANSDSFTGINISLSLVFRRLNVGFVCWKWHPSRPGYYYFSYNNGTSAGACQQGEKVAARVLRKPPEEEINPSLSPSPSEAPPPSAGGIFRSSPALPWRKLAPPASAPAVSPVAAPVARPDSGGGIPFITSNPAVPLPTGETDAATIRPLPTSGAVEHHAQAYLGILLLVSCI